MAAFFETVNVQLATTAVSIDSVWVAVAVNIIGMAFGFGVVFATVKEIVKRQDRFEQKLDRLYEPIADEHNSRAKLVNRLQHMREEGVGPNDDDKC